jgi:hypothetical protein
MDENQFMKKKLKYSRPHIRTANDLLHTSCVDGSSASEAADCEGGSAVTAAQCSVGSQAVGTVGLGYLCDTGTAAVSTNGGGGCNSGTVAGSSVLADACGGGGTAGTTTCNSGTSASAL